MVAFGELVVLLKEKLKSPGGRFGAKALVNLNELIHFFLSFRVDRFQLHKTRLVINEAQGLFLKPRFHHNPSK